MKKFTLLILLLSALTLHSRPKLEVSLSNVHPDYPEWYKRYDLNLTMNPSPRLGLRARFGSLDFEDGYCLFNLYSYGYSYDYPYSMIDVLFYFTRGDVSLYSILRLSAGFGSSTFFFYGNTGFGVDWYFSDRAACFMELQDFLMFYLSSYGGGTGNVDGNPGIIFGLKFGIY